MTLKDTTHYVNGQDMVAPIPPGHEEILLGMGCFWGVERIFWKLNGVHVTSVGYAGGSHDKPDYHTVCSGRTGHAEVVRVVFDPKIISHDELFKVFFENHDPTQGNRQGNDIGTQYRSAIYTVSDRQTERALAARDRYNKAYQDRGLSPITTEIKSDQTYHVAEEYHQQYLAKNPNGYCGIGGTGVTCPVPASVTA